MSEVTKSITYIPMETRTPCYVQNSSIERPQPDTNARTCPLATERTQEPKALNNLIIMISFTWIY